MSISNILLWGVESDEEVQKIVDSIDVEKMKKEGNWFEIKGSNPYISTPKSEWTEEMKENLRKFKEKHPELYDNSKNNSRQ